MLNKLTWIKDLKIGDTVGQIESHPSMPNGHTVWEAKVVNVASNYIETEYYRDANLEWLQVLIAKLANNHRTFSKQHQKNYFGPNGEINLELLVV